MVKSVLKDLHETIFCFRFNSQIIHKKLCLKTQQKFVMSSTLKHRSCTNRNKKAASTAKTRKTVKRKSKSSKSVKEIKKQIGKLKIMLTTINII